MKDTLEPIPTYPGEQVIPFDFKDNGTVIPAEIRVGSEGSVSIRVAGYGDKTSIDGCGVPIVIEHLEGVLKVTVWADINNEDATDSICMDQAKESCYQKI